MEFTIDWSNQNGISFNGVNQNNYNKPNTWLKSIGSAFNEKRFTLVSGEVYSCARFGNDWRGMKIVKK